MSLKLTSPAFIEDGKIPSKYSCDNEQPLSPPLLISGAPRGTKSFALIMDDPDIPAVFKESRGVEVFNHWVVYNIPPNTTGILEDETKGETGFNGKKEPFYIGPCPPPEYEPSEHRYIFTLYALSETVHFSTPPTKEELLAAITSLIIEQTTLTGRYSRK